MTPFASYAPVKESAGLRKFLLSCGILSSLLYITINAVVPLQYEGYSIANQTVSELSALGAPTRSLWVGLASFYVLLFACFGWGIWISANGNRTLRTLAILILVYSFINIYWPPMQMRGNPMALTDVLHIAWSMAAILFMWTFMVLGAFAFGGWFKLYTLLSIGLHVVFGALTAWNAPALAANQPTPLMGVWERVNIGVYMIWVIVLAVMLLQKPAVKITD